MVKKRKQLFWVAMINKESASLFRKGMTMLRKEGFDVVAKQEKNPKNNINIKAGWIVESQFRKASNFVHKNF